MSMTGPFVGNLREVDAAVPAPTAPDQVVIQPQRTPVEIARSIADGCLGPVKTLDEKTYARVRSAVIGAVQATIERERLEISARGAEA